MYVAIRDEETTYIGITNREYISGQPEDGVLEENLSITRGQRGEGIMVATDGRYAAADMVLEKAKKLSGEINAEKMVKEIEPMVRECHDFYNQSGNDGTYKTSVLVATKDAAFEIYGSVSKLDFIPSEYKLDCKCAYLASEGMPAKDRLLFVFREAERMNNISLFPISIYDVRTGKRKIYRR